MNTIANKTIFIKKYLKPPGLFALLFILLIVLYYNSVSYGQNRKASNQLLFSEKTSVNNSYLMSKGFRPETLVTKKVATTNSLKYPAARRDNKVDTYFGTKVPVPYQWMENINSPAVKKWVTEENKLTFSYLDKIPVRKWIHNRLTKLWNYAKTGTPDQVEGGRIFFSKNSGLLNQAIVYVQDSPESNPRMLIDPNKLSPNGSIALAGYQPSPDGKYLAYELSQGGSDWQIVHVLNVSTGKELADKIQWVKFSNISWTNDDGGFYYSRYPEPPKGEAIKQKVINQKLYYHKLGTKQSEDKLIYARPDLPEWIIEGDVSEDGQYLFVYLINGTAPQNELYYANLGDPLKPNVTASLKPLYTKNDAQYLAFGHKNNMLFLQTTLDAPKGRIVSTNFNNPNPSGWKTIVPEGTGVVQSASMADGHILVDYQVIAKSQVSLFTTDGKSIGKINFPDIGSVAGISTLNKSPKVYYGFSSFLYPTSIYSYNINTAKSKIFFKPNVDFDQSKYETKQVFYKSKDGTEIPMFIVAKKGLNLDGKNPTILYGYGGFDITITPYFNPILPVWLELGGVYAVANLRGGGTYGEKWHEAGMLGNKQNVFDDFAWAAKFLIKENYTSSKYLGIQGYSNGGLLIGASITQHPELFGAAYAGAGVMDMLRYQKFSGGALWAPEYGTSNNPKAFKWLYAYSPLANIKKGVCYPPTIITTADHDDRVVPSHSYKFTAKLQYNQGCSNPVLIRVATETSHGYMPTDKRIAQTADVWAFEAYNLGIKQPPAQSMLMKPLHENLEEKVDSAAIQVLRETGVPSASVAVVLHGKLQYANAYGMARLNPPMKAKPDMAYAIGSISKQFAAASILLLEQEGKLTLNDHISRWFPDLTDANKVTVREILSHTSGYQDFWPQDYVPPLMLKPMPPQEILDRWAKKPLDFKPGTKWQYSNTNFVIAAQIVEKITHEPFFKFLHQHILAPLGLSSAVNFDAGKLTSKDPSGYTRYGLGPVRPAPKEGTGWMSGAGELAMTASDLAKWDISLIDESLLSRKSYKQLETEVRLKSGVGTHYGLGVEVGMMDNHRMISHSGEVSGFTANNMVFPDDSAAVVVLTNEDAASAAGAISNRIAHFLFKTQDSQTSMRTEQARNIFIGLQHGKIDRSLFTADANAYFSKQALKDFQTGLDSLGAPKEFVQTYQHKRGGMLERVFRVVFPYQTLRVWTYQMPDGKLEQYQVAPQPAR